MRGLVVWIVVALLGAQSAYAQADQPRQVENLNIPALIRDALDNGKGSQLLTEYTYTMKLSERRTNNKGEVKETVETYESYIPTLKVQGNTAAVLLKLTDKGAPLSEEKIEKERQKAAEQLLKANAEAQKQNGRLPVLHDAAGPVLWPRFANRHAGAYAGQRIQRGAARVAGRA
jgi:hypothetical protein